MSLLLELSLFRPVRFPNINLLAYLILLTILMCLKPQLFFSIYNNDGKLIQSELERACEDILTKQCNYYTNLDNNLGNEDSDLIVMAE